MGVTAAIVSAVAAVAGAGQAYMGGQQQKKASKKAQATAEANASAQEQDMNRRNAKTPNIGALSTANQGAATSTSLTGPTGIDPSSLMLGKNTLLGQ